ncbi:MAG TPA: Hsp70 family protein [Actinocatenispora sp.]
MNGFRLSIDYGTSNTVAVLRGPDGRTAPLLFDGAPLLPSAVYLGADGQLATGRDAARSARLDPSRYEPHPKRRIDDGEVLLADRAVPVAELAAATLRRVAAEARRVAGAPIGSLTMTCPVAWGPTRRAMLSDAAARAGLPAPTLVPEPVAAATYFVSALGHQVPPGRSVVVYDLGGGTFDACVVRRTAGGFEPLAYLGLDDVGGVDLDGLVLAQVGRAVSATAPDTWRRLSQPTDQADRRAFRTLWDDARAAKEALSRQPTVNLFVPLVERDVHVSREDFERDARPALDRTVETTMATIRAARVQPADVAGIFLVGGSTRVPMVATLLHQASGRAPAVLEQPEIVVAEGGLHATAPSAAPVTSAPMSGVPMSGAPMSGVPMSGVPVSAHPASLAPYSAVPASGPTRPGPAGPGATTGLAASGPMAPYQVPVPKKRMTPQIRKLLIGGVIAAVLIVVGTFGVTMLHQQSRRNSTLDLYHKVGLPAGFSEQSDPTMKSNTWLTAKATSNASDAPAKTHDWLAGIMANAPSADDLETNYYGRTPPQFVAADKFGPHSVSFHLSKSGSTYLIETEIIY